MVGFPDCRRCKLKISLHYLCFFQPASSILPPQGG
jgi:hypothetical protein